MPNFIIPRPDGRWAIYNTVVDDFVLDEASEGEVVEMFVEDSAINIRGRVRVTIAEIKEGVRAAKMSYEEACAARDFRHGREKGEGDE